MMENDLKIAQQVDRAIEAKRIMEHPLFIEAQAQVKAAILAQWTQTPINSADERERLWLMYQMHERVVKLLRSTIETGKIAEHHLTRDKRKLWPVG